MQVTTLLSLNPKAAIESFPRQTVKVHEDPCALQVTTLLSRHDQALSQPAVTEEELQHLEKQIVDQGNAVKEAKAATKIARTPEAKAQVSIAVTSCPQLTCSLHTCSQSINQPVTCIVLGANWGQQTVKPMHLTIATYLQLQTAYSATLTATCHCNAAMHLNNDGHR